MTPRRAAFFIFLLALLRSVFLLLVAAPYYGADGAFYLRYMDSFIAGETDLEQTFGTTPIYPLFAYVFYNLAGGNGIIAAQIVLGALGAAAACFAFYPIHQTGAVVAGVLLAVDPQTGHLLQLVSTEGLYIPLLTLAMAFFFYEVYREKPLAFALGIFIGISSLTRPVGIYLILPYILCYVLITRSIKRTALVAAGYAVIYLMVCLINLWRFDFFGVNSTNGFYLGARLFSQEGLYQPENGEASRKLADLAADCNVDLGQKFETYEAIRSCTDTRLSYEESSKLYQEAYFEAVRKSPQEYITGFVSRFLRFNWRQSNAYLADEVVSRPVACRNLPDKLVQYSIPDMFCPSPPTPLSGLREIVFTGILGFSIFTRSFINFTLALVLFPIISTRLRWVFLFCFLGYIYHAAATSAANDLLSRYVTVTNPYTLVTSGFCLVLLYQEIAKRRGLAAPVYSS